MSVDRMRQVLMVKNTSFVNLEEMSEDGQFPCLTGMKKVNVSATVATFIVVVTGLLQRKKTKSISAETVLQV